MPPASERRSDPSTRSTHPLTISRRLLLLFLLFGLVSATSVEAADAPPDSTADTATPWISLFDGKTMRGWRNYQSQHVSDGWRVADGLLLCSGDDAGDLITEDQFQDFELYLEWRVEQGGNSGVFFRATEAEPRIYLSAPEMQILDDAGHKDGRDPLTSAGSNYALHPAPRGVVRPAGQWNQARLRVVGNHVTHWLNGIQIVDYDLGSDDWRARVADSKFADWPNYGKAARGHIGLQDHGDPVAFRDIRIRTIGETP